MTQAVSQTQISSDLSLNQSFQHNGAVAIITNEARDQFIIQKKDYEYRIPSYRDGLSLFGGGTEEGEFSRDTLQRELPEEVLSPVIDKILDSAKAWESFKLDGFFTYGDAVKKFEFRLFVYESVLSSEWFERASNEMLNRDNIDEGSALCVSADELWELALSDEQDEFVFNIGRVIRAYLEYSRS